MLKRREQPPKRSTDKAPVEALEARADIEEMDAHQLARLVEKYGVEAVRNAAGWVRKKPANRPPAPFLDYEKAADADWIDALAEEFEGERNPVELARTAFFYIKNDHRFLEFEEDEKGSPILKNGALVLKKDLPRVPPTAHQLDAIRKRHEEGKRIAAAIKQRAKSFSKAVPGGNKR